MKVNALVLLGAVAPLMISGSASHAAQRTVSVIVVAQQQTDAGNKVEADKKAEEKRRRQHHQPPAKSAKPAPQTRATAPAQHKGRPQSTHPQNQKPATSPLPKQGERDHERNRKPAAAQQHVQPPAPKQPAVTQQPAPVRPQRPAANQQPPAMQGPAAAAKQPKRLEDLRGQRRETHEGNRTIIRERDRTIVRENGHAFIRHDDSDRFRHGARSVQNERRNGQRVTVVVRPDGTRITTVWDNNGRVLRRTSRAPGRREQVLYENHARGAHLDRGFVVHLGSFVPRIPRDRYIVDADRADNGLLYDTLIAGPLEPIAQPYTLDEVLYSYDLRERMRRVDLDTINFESGSWEVTPVEARRLGPIAEAIRRAIQRNPYEVFLVEGHTDAVGSPDDNLLLSDHRAEAVAEVLTEMYGIPPENLVTQGYGEQYLKVATQGPDRRNRRVTVRRITPLLARQ